MFSTSPLPQSVADATSYRTWVQAVHNAIASFGWTQTGDTGQLTISTLAARGNGYEIWALGDTLQATHPFYMKLEYHPTAFGPGFFVTFGTATDGAGNITTQTSQRLGFGCRTDTTVQQNCYFSGDTNRLQMALWDGPTSNESVVISIERSKNSSGVDTGDALLVFLAASNNNGTGSGLYGAWSGVVPSSGTVVNAQNVWSAPFNQAQLTMAYGSAIGVGIPIPFNTLPYQYGMGVLIYQSSDFGYATFPIVPIYGANHNYIALNQNTYYSATNPSCNTHILMRYE